MYELTTAEHDELRNIRQNQPVFPGDTLSHATVKTLSDLSLVTRNREGDWVAPVAS